MAGQIIVNHRIKVVGGKLNCRLQKHKGNMHHLQSFYQIEDIYSQLISNHICATFKNINLNRLFTPPVGYL